NPPTDADAETLTAEPEPEAANYQFETQGTPVYVPAPDLPSVAGYEVLEVLGRGGMGVVYRARQKGLNRLVALKMVLAGSHAGPEDLARFHLEAEAVARLQHPNIVQVFEVGQEDGQPFVAFEFVDGGSLQQHLKKQSFPERQAAQLVETLARAMHF